LQAFIRKLSQLFTKLQGYQRLLNSSFKTLVEKVRKHLNSFHALHAPLKMDRLDYTFKFSTELIVLVLSLIVIIFNAVGGTTGLAFADANNFYARELSYRSGANKELYSRNTSSTTVVTAGSGLIPQAAAEAVLVSDQTNQTDSANSQNSIISDNAIVADTQDNIRGMIASEIQSYTVQNGDTLAALSKKFGISVSTIIWANNLTSDLLKPGTELTILPVDGVLYKVKTNDTLPDIAKGFKADINQIISFNGLTDDQDINPGDLILVPNGVIPAPPKPTAPPTQTAKHIVRGKTVYTPIIDLTPSTGHLFPGGQCTYYIAFRRDALGKPVTWGGNARDWLRNAAAQGVPEGSVPQPGAIVVTNDSRRYGHVALVEDVEDGNILVSEMNFYGLWKTDQRLIPIDSSTIRGYIY